MEQMHLEGEGEGEGDFEEAFQHNLNNSDEAEDEEGNKYNNMVMAMANQMLADKLEKEQLDAAIQLSLAPEENAQ